MAESLKRLDTRERQTTRPSIARFARVSRLLAGRRLRVWGLALLVALPIVSGCSSVRFSPESRQSIRRVRIATQVEEEASFSGNLPGVAFETRGEAWYGSWITAPIGIFLDLIDLSENARRRSTALRRRMAADGISVPRIVRAALRERLEEGAVFVDADAHSPDGVIHLSIEHGLDDGFGLRGSWRPWIEIRASLLDGEGAVHWRAKAEVPPSDDRLGELDAPFATPERLEAVYAKASAIAVDALLRHLAGE